MKPGESKGKTNWDELRARRKSAAPPSENQIKEAREYWADADVVIPGGKTRMTVRFDTDVVEWFKSHGSKYQTRMNAVLRQFMSNQRENSDEVTYRAPVNAESVDNQIFAAYLDALNQLGKIRLTQGNEELATSCFEEAINSYRLLNGTHSKIGEMMQPSAIIDQQLPSCYFVDLKSLTISWFGHSRAFGFKSSQKILMDIEAEVLH